LNPDNLEVLNQKKDALKVLGRHEDVIFACERIIELDPKNVYALRDKAEAFENLDRLEEAVDLYNKVLKTHPKDVTTMQKRGSALSKMGLYEESLESYDNALGLEKKNKALWNEKGIVLTKMEDYDQAIKCFDSALKLDPQDDDILTNKGLALYESRSFDEAITTLDQAISQSPSNIQALKGKGRALMATDEFESAVRVFDRILDAMPEDLESWVSKAEAYMTLGRFEGAIGCYDRAIGLDENNKSHWINRGILLDKTGKFNEAIASYDRALKLDEKDASIWHKKGKSLVKVGDLEQAVASYDRALGLSPNNKRIWTSKGIVLNNMDNFEQALRCFDHALELDSKFIPAQEGKERAKRETEKRAIERYAREILRFEKEYKRPATKEEAFKVCHVPYSYLDSVIEYLSKKVEIDINALGLKERELLEKDSNRAIVGAIRSDPASFERYGIRLADITLNFPDYDIPKAKRLSAYINKVDGMEIKLDTVEPELEELLSRGMELPPNKRTVNDLIQDLHLGIYDAKRVHALLLQFGDQQVVTPETRVRSLGGAYPYEGPGPSESGSYVESEGEPIDYETPRDVEVEPPEDICLICEKNPVFVEHECGAKLCKDCLAEYNERYAKLYDGAGDETVCPKCGEPIVIPKKRKGRGKKGDEEYIRL
jgi:tetratricopeptide (TPR) repeat protein